MKKKESLLVMTANTMINEALITELEKIAEPGPLMAELERRFPGRVAIGTSGQLTGCALIDMAVQAGVKPRVFTVDTGRQGVNALARQLLFKLDERWKASA